MSWSGTSTGWLRSFSKCGKTQCQGQELGSGVWTDATRSFQNTSLKSMSCHPGAGCVAEDVGGHAPEPRGLPADAARKVDAACAVRQRFPKDATTIPGETTDILELPERVRQAKWKQQEHEALTRWLASSSTVGERTR